MSNEKDSRLSREEYNAIKLFAIESLLTLPGEKARKHYGAYLKVREIIRELRS